MKYSRKIVAILMAAFSLSALSAPLLAEDKGSEGGIDMNSLLVHHLMDSVIWEWNIGGSKVYAGQAGWDSPKFIRRYTFKDADGKLYRYAGGLPMHITRRVMMIFLISGILILVLVGVSRAITKNPMRIGGKFTHMIEVLVQWVRNDIAEESMHHQSKGFQPYILTLFFFILALNLAGLFPPIGEGILKLNETISGHHHAAHGMGDTESGLIAIWPGMTATGDIAVTLALSLITVVMMWITGFRYQGYKFLWHVVPDGVPALLYLIMWPLEFLIGPIIKGVALTIRLLANMTGGHVIILALMTFIFQAKGLYLSGVGGIFGGAGVTAAALGGVIAIYFLEIMVAFLQAFIFSLLSSLFIGSMMHRH